MANTFRPLYYQEKLNLIHPEGDVGVITLWSPIRIIRRHMATTGINFDPDNSRIAVIGTLYGNGLPELLRNLLYNPQIHHLLLFGVDLGEARESVIGFFERGLETTTYLGTKMYRIIGTNRMMDDQVMPEDFAGDISLTNFGQPNDSLADQRIQNYFSNLPSKRPPKRERIERSIPQVEITRFPSEPRSHVITRESTLDAWKELIFRLVRFGHRNRLKKGERIELLNVKVVVTNPEEEGADRLRQHGFSPEDFDRYQKEILNPELPSDQKYGYGHRLRRYFRGSDTLLRMVEMLTKDPDSRHCYVSLWDTGRDLLSGSRGRPCLISLYFRRYEKRLTMTAIFRAHNALDGWMRNFYGLMAIQRFVCRLVEMDPGAITVISHSITVDPSGHGFDRAQAIAKAKKIKQKLRIDPNGNFVVTVDQDKGEIVVEHRHQGQCLTRYRGKKAIHLESQLARDGAISLITHALYLGRELTLAEFELTKGYS